MYKYITRVYTWYAHHVYPLYNHCGKSNTTEVVVIRVDSYLIRHNNIIVYKLLFSCERARLCVRVCQTCFPRITII